MQIVLLVCCKANKIRVKNSVTLLTALKASFLDSRAPQIKPLGGMFPQLSRELPHLSTDIFFATMHADSLLALLMGKILPEVVIREGSI